MIALKMSDEFWLGNKYRHVIKNNADGLLNPPKKLSGTYIQEMYQLQVFSHSAYSFKFLIFLHTISAPVQSSKDSIASLLVHYILVL